MQLVQKGTGLRDGPREAVVKVSEANALHHLGQRARPIHPRALPTGRR